MNARSLRGRILIWSAASVLSWLLVAGCGPRYPSTVPVTGTVTYRGQPVEGANVLFSRASGDLSKGELAVGKTDANGKFELISHFGSQASAKGAVPGKYEVTISKHVPPPGMTPAQYQALVAAADKISEAGGTVPAHQQPPPLVQMFPPHYSMQGKSKLSTEVASAGTNDFTFTLE